MGTKGCTFNQVKLTKAVIIRWTILDRSLEEKKKKEKKKKRRPMDDLVLFVSAGVKRNFKPPETPGTRETCLSPATKNMSARGAYDNKRQDESPCPPLPAKEQGVSEKDSQDTIKKSNRGNR